MSVTDGVDGSAGDQAVDHAGGATPDVDQPRAGGTADNLLRAAYVFFALAVAAAIYLVVARDGDDGGDAADPANGDHAVTADGASEADDGSATTTGSTAVEAPAGANTTVADTGASTADTSTGTTSPPTTEPAVDLRGVLDGETVAISGVVPSEDAADAVVDAVARLLPDDDIEAELAIDPDAPVPTGLTIVVADSVSFAPNSAAISPDFFPLLDRLARLMSLDPNVSMVVAGHTDTGGDEISNLALSQQRAEAARSYLVGTGLNEFRIEAIGRGDTEPVADNETFNGRVQNRRIEFELLGLRFDVET